MSECFETPPDKKCSHPGDWINFPSTGCITGLLFGGPCTRSNAFISRCADPSGYDQDTCSCPDGQSNTPIVIDVDRSGFSMSDADLNGKIDAQDSVFSELRLWQDVNHNGYSEACELKPFGAFGITGIDLDYKESKKTDEFGNKFRYRAKV